mgnify:CR=1 FL=1
MAATGPPSLPATGFAVCPACAARNPFDARTCGRCAAAIPPPGASAPLAVAQPGAGIALRLPARSSLDPPPEDPLAVLPPQVREQILAARAASQARGAAALTRERQRERAIGAASGAAAALAGLLVSAVLLDGWIGTIAAALFDAAVGTAAGVWVYRRGGGTHRGLLAYALAAFASAGLKLALGGIPVGLSAGAAFAVLLPVTWGAAIAGGLLGQRIDDWLWDQV